MNSKNVAVVFAGQNALDQSEIRLGVLRIPEVTQRLRECQTLLEQAGTTKGIDLRAQMLVDDKDFGSHARLRSLLCAVVQVGLFERWNKIHSLPNYLIGHSNLDSPLQFAAGRKSLEDIVLDSAFLGRKQPTFANQMISTPLLGGIELVEYEISILNQATERYISIRSHEMDALRLFSYMADQLPIDEIVNIGPGCPLFSNYNKILNEKKIMISDSINLDPMLGWFWNSIRPVDAISQ